MNQEATELYRFLTTIYSDPFDLETKRVFADWLDDHDEPELAEEQRYFCSEEGQRKLLAECRLKEVAKEFAGGDYEGMLKGLQEGDYNFSDSSFRYGIDWQELWQDVETVTGSELSCSVKDRGNFSCSC